MSYKDLLNERKTNFVSVIDKFITESEERMLAVTRGSLQDMIEEMQTPEGQKGGKMKVQTGFLRMTGRAALNEIPQGPDIRDATQTYNWDNNGNLIEILAKMKIGDTFVWGWTANYADVREAYDAFMDSSLQNWSKHVEVNTKKIKKRLKK